MSPCLKEDRGAEFGAHWVGEAWQPGMRWPRQGRWWPLSWRRELKPCRARQVGYGSWGAVGALGGAGSLGGKRCGEASLGSGLSGN